MRKDQTTLYLAERDLALVRELQGVDVSDSPGCLDPEERL